MQPEHIAQGMRKPPVLGKAATGGVRVKTNHLAARLINGDGVAFSEAADAIE